MNVSKEDQAKMLKLIDKNNTGYLTFTDFSKVFKPTMSESLVTVPQKDSYLPNLQPSIKKNEQQVKEQEGFIQTVSKIQKGFDPAHDNRK